MKENFILERKAYLMEAENKVLDTKEVEEVATQPKKEFKSADKTAKLFYILSIVMAVIFLLMVIGAVKYIVSYVSSYGIGAMWMEVVQYIVGNSFSYIVYAAIFFGIAKILSKLNADAPGVEAEPKAEAKVEVKEELTVKAETKAETVAKPADENVAVENPSGIDTKEILSNN